MRITSNKLSSAVRLALLTGVLTMGAASVAFAQDSGTASSTDKAASTKPTQLKTVTVTGSRIRSADIATQQPVFVMTQADIQKTGLVSVGDIVQRMTSSGTPAFTRSSPLISNSEQGGRYANLRNLGANRVLVLVNGKRWATSPAGYTDLSNIPSSLIERVEVLKDGASAVYGSDAITGVINFILKDHYDGAEANVYYGQNQKGDGVTKRDSFTMGSHNDKGSIVFSVEHESDGLVKSSTRAKTKYGYGSHMTTGVGPYGWIYDPNGNLLAINHTGTDSLGLGVGADSRDPNNYHPYAGSPADRFNYVSQEDQQSPSNMTSIFTHGVYHITDHVDANMTAMYASRHSVMQVAGYPNSSYSQPNYPVFIDANNYYNPFPGNDLSFYRRTIEIPRVSTADAKSFHLDGGLSGWFDVGQHEWNWDAGFNFNRQDTNLISTGNLNLVALKAALGPSFMNANGVVQCGTPNNPIPLGTSLNAGECTPFNIIGGPSASTKQALDFVNSRAIEQVRGQDRAWNANVTGGLFNLPGGEFSFAAGVQSRQVSGYDYPDPINQAGLTTNLAANSTIGKYRVNSAYLELNAPLLKDLPGANSLSIDVASRYSHYSNFGSTTNNKYSIAWKPIEDLLIRANYAEGFRAPTIGDLFGGGSQTFDNYLDPCDSAYGAAATSSAVAANCAAAGVPANFRQVDQGGSPVPPGGAQSTVPFNVGGGNLALQPETSVTKTLGFVYSPSYVQGLDVKVDWYNIKVSNVITGISADYVLGQCYVQGVQSFCNQQARDPVTHQVTSLSRGNANLGSLEEEGYDWSVNYRLPQMSIGQFSVTVNGTYLIKDNSQSQAGAPITNGVGTVPDYRNRVNAGIDWSMGDWAAHYGFRYFSSLIDDTWSCAPGALDHCNMPNYQSPTNPYLGGVGADRLGSETFQDVSVAWNAPWNAQIRVGINNLWNKKPQTNFLASEIGYNTTSAVDPNKDLDRYYYVSYTQKF